MHENAMRRRAVRTFDSKDPASCWPAWPTRVHGYTTPHILAIDRLFTCQGCRGHPIWVGKPPCRSLRFGEGNGNAHPLDVKRFDSAFLLILLKQANPAGSNLTPPPTTPPRIPRSERRAHLSAPHPSPSPPAGPEPRLVDSPLSSERRPRSPTLPRHAVSPLRIDHERSWKHCSYGHSPAPQAATAHEILTKAVRFAPRSRTQRRG